MYASLRRKLQLAAGTALMSNIDHSLAQLAGLHLAQAESGLMRGHVALATGETPWWFGVIADLPAAIPQFPNADTIVFYQGDLSVVRALFAKPRS